MFKIITYVDNKVRQKWHWLQYYLPKKKFRKQNVIKIGNKGMYALKVVVLCSFLSKKFLKISN